MRKAELLDCSEPYLVTPVSRRFRISQGVGLEELAGAGAHLSGLSALARMSDLASDDMYPAVVVPRDGLPGALVVLGESVEELPWWDEEGVEVEGWGYWDDKPVSLRDDAAGCLDAVGRLSLYLSLGDRFEDDVRVSDAIDQLREEICQS